MSETTRHADQLYATSFGHAAAPVVAVIGVWDPFLLAHRELFSDLAASARTRGLCSLVVVIDPDPGLLLWGRAARPIFADFPSRLRLIQQCGVDLIVQVHFTKRSLRATASDFLDLLGTHATISELWVGANQMLGNGPQGTIEGIRAQAHGRHIRLEVLPELGVKALGYQALGLVKAGEVVQATVLAGYCPLRARPRTYRSRAVEVAWTPGTYSAHALQDPSAPPTGPSIPVELTSGPNGMAQFRWPDPTAPYLAFVAGPKDGVRADTIAREALGADARPASIIARSATLYERLNGTFAPASETASGEQTGDTLRVWAQAVAGGSDELLARRLLQEGHNLHSIVPLLGPVALVDGAEIASWVTVLVECLHTYDADAAGGTRGAPAYTAGADHIAFQDVLFPCVDLATTRLASAAGISMRRLTPSGLVALQRHLLQHLADITYQTLHLEYSVYQMRRQRPVDRLVSLLDTGASNDQYDGFVRRLLSGGMLVLFEEYPSLARLVAIAIDHWIQSMTEFLFRLDRDLKAISDEMYNGTDIGAVTDVQGGLSDPHNGGRSVLVLRFSSGDQLVYKPKDLQLEYHYARLQEWINDHGAPMQLHPLKVLPRFGYGWAEYVSQRACASQAAVERYFFRSGMILCLMYVLEGTDFHNENIIASGEHPQIIDLETLFHHHLQAAEDIESPSARALAEQRIWKSVLRTMLLPNWVVNKDGSSTDTGGLGSDAVVSDGFSDDSTHTPATALTRANIVYLESGECCPAGEYVEHIVQGFEALYQILLANRTVLTGPDGPLQQTKGLRVRFVLRPTETYSALTRKALRPEYLRDGLLRSIQLDALSTIFIQDQVKAAHWPVLRAEHRAIERLDIPYFAAYAGGDTLYFSDGSALPHFFPQPSFPEVMENLAHLSDEDLDLQKQFIRLSYTASAVRDGAATPVVSGPVRAAEDCPQALNADDLIEEGVRIADHLAKTAIVAADKSLTWIGLQYHPYGRRYQLRPIGYDLYGGCAGIGLFLAAIARVTGVARYKDVALGAVQTARQVMPTESIGKRFAELMGIGGFTGMGSVAYALSCMASLLGDASCYRDACCAAFCIGDDLILQDTKYDVLSGSAGLILALLSLHASNLSDTVPTHWKERLLELAVRSGDHLVTGRTASQSGHRAWATMDGALYTGFSHGAAGIAYALLRLCMATGENTYRTAAAEAIAYEQSLYSPEHQNWPHFELDPGRHQFLTQWCHGAPGIGLARIGAFDVAGPPHVDADIEVALATTLNYGYAPADYLCCGNLGRSSILLEAGRALQRRQLVQAAQELAAHVVGSARKRANGSVLGWHVVQPTRNPGFMRGLSGVGYGLLALATDDGILPVALRLAGQSTLIAGAQD